MGSSGRKNVLLTANGDDISQNLALHLAQGGCRLILKILYECHLLFASGLQKKKINESGNCYYFWVFFLWNKQIGLNLYMNLKGPFLFVFLSN